MNITICLSTYNGTKHIEQQLDSIINQTYSDWLLKIRDDGSVDGTFEILQKYAQKYEDKIQIIGDGNENIGVTQSFAKLIESCATDYIMLCDQDDVWLSDKIELSFKAIKKLEAETEKSKPLLVFTDAKVVDENLNVLNNSFWETQKITPKICNNYKKLLALNAVTGCTVIFNRFLVSHILPMPDFLKVHDGWIAVNAAYYGKLDYIQQPTMLYRQHTTNVFGAHKIGFSYFRSKMNFQGFKNFRLYMKSFSFKVSLAQIMWYKICFSVLRIFKKT